MAANATIPDRLTTLRPPHFDSDNTTQAWPSRWRVPPLAYHISRSALRPGSRRLKSRRCGVLNEWWPWPPSQPSLAKRVRLPRRSPLGRRRAVRRELRSRRADQNPL